MASAVMKDSVRVIGSYLSPYVRKVLVCLDLKGIPYEIDPIVPFMGDERFSKLSPLRRIPVLLDDRVTLADSSVICEYLEDRHPEPALYPRDAMSRARARWLEEFADTRMGEVFIWRLFNQVAIRPFVWGEQTDDALVARTLAKEREAIAEEKEKVRAATSELKGKDKVTERERIRLQALGRELDSLKTRLGNRERAIRNQEAELERRREEVRRMRAKIEELL